MTYLFPRIDLAICIPFWLSVGPVPLRPNERAYYFKDAARKLAAQRLGNWSCVELDWALDPWSKAAPTAVWQPAVIAAELGTILRLDVSETLRGTVVADNGRRKLPTGIGHTDVAIGKAVGVDETLVVDVPEATISYFDLGIGSVDIVVSVRPAVGTEASYFGTVSGGHVWDQLIRFVIDAVDNEALHLLHGWSDVRDEFAQAFAAMPETLRYRELFSLRDRSLGAPRRSDKLWSYGINRILYFSEVQAAGAQPATVGLIDTLSLALFDGQPATAVVDPSDRTGSLYRLRLLRHAGDRMLAGVDATGLALLDASEPVRTIWGHVHRGWSSLSEASNAARTRTLESLRATAGPASAEAHMQIKGILHLEIVANAVISGTRDDRFSASPFEWIMYEMAMNSWAISDLQATATANVGMLAAAEKERRRILDDSRNLTISALGLCITILTLLGFAADMIEFVTQTSPSDPWHLALAYGKLAIYAAVIACLALLLYKLPVSKWVGSEVMRALRQRP